MRALIFKPQAVIMTARLLALTLILGLWACSSHRSMVVLLPDADGKVGVIEVRTESGARVIAEAYHGLRIDGTPSMPEEIDLAAVERSFGRTLSVLPESQYRFSSSRVFFRFDSTDLTDESRAQLPGQIRSIRSLNPIGVYFVGHTDTVGPEGYNLELSHKRASAVKTLFSAAGLRCPMVPIAYGKSKPMANTGGESAINRRVEIVVKFSPQSKGG
jgi:outer membrane protein OmpA-like peptidoglycan-associated protein